MTYKKRSPCCEHGIRPDAPDGRYVLQYVRAQLRDGYGGGPAIWETLCIEFGNGVIPKTFCDLDGKRLSSGTQKCISALDLCFYRASGFGPGVENA